MITIDILCRTVSGLQPEQVEQWIGNAWLHAEGAPGHYRFDAEVIGKALFRARRCERHVRHGLQGRTGGAWPDENVIDGSARSGFR